ncbi:MAG TPA: SDR family oxidoreductase [Symbiobacteriaceae bacterium]|jgi:acyl transferase domain-containing protein
MAAVCGHEVAIIGMAGRFPGADHLEQFWQNLRDGVGSIRWFSDEELLATGVDPVLLRNPRYVKAGAPIKGPELFDAAFFGYRPREAELVDPHDRLMLESAWHALENAGYNPDTYDGQIGLFAGTSANRYLVSALAAEPAPADLLDLFQAGVGGVRNAIAGLLSYKLNLTGPSVGVQAACSTSLVAVHLACRSLLDGECDMALAGGVSVRVPQVAGYLYRADGMFSPDGQCRAFDADAGGTVGGSGVGVVVLKRLADALAHGDTICAVIRGSAINHDGALKEEYADPSVQGEATVIAKALAAARIEPETVSYVEAHGTGSRLGDPSEIAALTQAFRAGTERTGFCAIGSVKTNIGHLDEAAGMAGLIKTVLALQHGQLPPTLHFQKANPGIDFANSPCYVNQELADWPAGQTPRRAGVSSFGLGGTNAHVVLEESPGRAASDPGRPWDLLMLSARTETALESMTDDLVQHLRKHPDLNPSDVAYTLQTGRGAFEHRRTVVVQSVVDAVAALESRDPKRVLTGRASDWERPVVFLFPGMGDHYVNMGAQLYREEPAFRKYVDRCAEFLKPLLGEDLREALYRRSESDAPAAGNLFQAFARSRSNEPAKDPIGRMPLSHAAMFVTEYALAMLLMEWGIRPAALIGYSLGEYVAACVAGVMTPEEALTLLVRRAEWIEHLPGGAMLAVSLPAESLQALLGEGLSLAVVNSGSLCVVSGEPEAVAALQRRLESDKVTCRWLPTTHAFHSEMLRPIAGQLAELVGTLNLEPPQIPYISNLTGTWITAAQAMDPANWAEHMCRTVWFREGVGTLWEQLNNPLMVEVGPGQALSSLTLQHPLKASSSDRTALTVLRSEWDGQPDLKVLLTAAARLWLAGLRVDWPRLHAGVRRHRLPLPVYPFERQAYSLQPRVEHRGQPGKLMRKPEPAEWFYAPSWKRSSLSVPEETGSPDRLLRWLVFTDGAGLGEGMAAQLEAAGHAVVRVRVGDGFGRMGDREYVVCPDRRSDYETLLADLQARGWSPERVIHCWTVAPGGEIGPDEARRLGFYSLVYLAHALASHAAIHDIRVSVISSSMHDVTGEERHVAPAAALILGPCKVIPQEYPHMTVRCIDVDWSPAPERQEQLLQRLGSEVITDGPEPVVAYRRHHRWVQTYDPVVLRSGGVPRLREGGVYLIIGGLGEMGLVLAEYLVRQGRAQLVLTGRSPFPSPTEWAERLAATSEADPLNRKIRKLQELESMGAEVLVLHADVADREQMTAVLAEIDRRYGALHGVIHSAGVTGAWGVCPVREATAEWCEPHFTAKVEGLAALAEVLAGRPLDFVLLSSSLSPILGGLGFAAYAAANAFMDAFANRMRQAGSVPWISLNWEGWRFGDQVHVQAALGATVTAYSLSPAQATQALDLVLSTELPPQLVISVGDLHGRLAQWTNPGSRLKTGLATFASSAGHSLRPSLPTPYLAPRTELEGQLCQMWADTLGIGGLGVYDNFFDLGGNSLMAVQLIARVRRTLQVAVDVQTLLTNSTPAALAEAVEEARMM